MSEHPPVLVTGGAGYIGSHVVLALRAAGHPCVVLDDLSTGRAEALPADVALVRGDVGDGALVEDVCRRHGVEGVLHFAGSIVVTDSLEQPLEYYDNNTCRSRTLIEAVVRAGVKALVFSSTAAVYGNPAEAVDETAPTQPTTPYGASKLMTEWMLRDADAAHGLPHVVLRYFNVAGADPEMRTGQVSRRATHLVKIACEAAVGTRPGMAIHGTDYPTPDGTCVRDYIHVSDLADAHVLALRHLLDGGRNLTLNCGYNRGFSVREVISAMERVLGRPLPVEEGPRRPGDVPRLVARAERIGTDLGWTPRHADLETILRTALEWERRLQNGGP